MLVTAPIEGALEWCCAPGDVVVEGAVLAWIAGPGRCGLVPMSAPAAGAIRWRRAAVLLAIGAGEPGVVLGDDPAALTTARAAEARALHGLRGQLERELAELAAGPTSPLSRALIEPQRAEAERRLAAVAVCLRDAPDR